MFIYIYIYMLTSITKPNKPQHYNNIINITSSGELQFCFMHYFFGFMCISLSSSKTITTIDIPTTTLLGRLNNVTRHKNIHPSTTLCICLHFIWSCMLIVATNECNTSIL